MKNYIVDDIIWLIGINNNNEIIALPFIFNKTGDKIKVLTDDKIFNLNGKKLILDFKLILENSYNAKLYTFYTFDEITKKETLNTKEIENYKYAFEMYFKNQIKAKDGPDYNFFKNDRYLKF